MRKNAIALITCFFIGFFVVFIVYNSINKITNPMKFFSKHSINKALKEEMIKKNIWSDQCPIPIERLNLLYISYIDFDGKENHDGKLIVHDVAADHVLEIFKALYENKFPIASIRLINEFDGNDEKSMESNNTSAFNCRKTLNNKLSIHSYGLAIDINPQQNPFLSTNYEMGKLNIPTFPPQGMEYINRRNIRSGMVETVLFEESGETVIDIFAKYGFTVWGGTWDNPIDWHHFQVTQEQAQIISELSYEEGKKFFNQITKSLQ